MNRLILRKTESNDQCFTTLMQYECWGNGHYLCSDCANKKDIPPRCPLCWNVIINNHHKCSFLGLTVVNIGENNTF